MSEQKEPREIWINDQEDSFVTESDFSGASKDWPCGTYFNYYYADTICFVPKSNYDSLKRELKDKSKLITSMGIRNMDQLEEIKRFRLALEKISNNYSEWSDRGHICISKQQLQSCVDIAREALKGGDE